MLLASDSYLVDLCRMEVEALEVMRAGPVTPEGLLFDRHVRNLLALRLGRHEGELLAITQRGGEQPLRSAGKRRDGTSSTELAKPAVTESRTARRIA